MRNHRLAIAAAAALLGLAGCQDAGDAPATDEFSEAPTRETVTPPGAIVPDSAAPAITDPASPTPEGTDVGAMGADATATIRAGDTAQANAAHP